MAVDPDRGASASRRARGRGIDLWTSGSKYICDFFMFTRNLQRHNIIVKMHWKLTCEDVNNRTLSPYACWALRQRAGLRFGGKHIRNCGKRLIVLLSVKTAVLVYTLLVLSAILGPVQNCSFKNTTVHSTSSVDKCLFDHFGEVRECDWVK